MTSLVKSVYSKTTPGISRLKEVRPLKNWPLKKVFRCMQSSSRKISTVKFNPVQVGFTSLDYVLVSFAPMNWLIELPPQPSTPTQSCLRRGRASLVWLLRFRFYQTDEPFRFFRESPPRILARMVATRNPNLLIQTLLSRGIETFSLLISKPRIGSETWAMKVNKE